MQRNWNAFKCPKTRLSFICMNSLSDLGVSSNLIVRYLGVIDHFTVVCLVAWPLNESEAEGDLVLIETSLLFSC